MSKQTTVATNLLGRIVILNDENYAAARQMIENDYGNLPPYVKLYPKGGEVVAVYQDQDRTLMVSVSGDTSIINLPADWLQEAPAGYKPEDCDEY